MARPFTLPDLGEGIHEGEILQVLVSEGDRVEEGDSILEIETDKAAVEVPSPFTATVEEIMVKEGDTVQVGDVLMTFSDIEGEAEEPEEKKERPERRKEEEPEAREVKKEEPEKETEKEEKPKKGEEPLEGEEEKELEKEGEVEQALPRKEGGPVPASPATRRLARELGVDLHQVRPSGPGGRVTAEDVQAHAGKPKKERPPEREEEAPRARPLEEKPPTLPDFSKWGDVERVPLRSIRRATARQMALAWSQIPHVSNQDWADVSQLETLRQKHKQEVEAKGGRLTLTVFALKAAATALKKEPRFNASLDLDSGEIVFKQYFHIGVAVATEEGLVVPVVRDVDRKSILEISVELKDLVQRAQERKISLEEMQGGTFSITNVGPLGGGHFAPIINYPEVAILGMGTARMKPVVREDGRGDNKVVARLMIPLVLCIDHRILDGADALKFMRVVIDALEDPEEMLMTMT